MTALLLLLIPAALAAGAPDSRIVGGSNVNIAEYPWQVTNTQCTAFIISNIVHKLLYFRFPCFLVVISYLYLCIVHIIKLFMSHQIITSCILVVSLLYHQVTSEMSRIVACPIKIVNSWPTTRTHTLRVNLHDK